MTTTNGTRAILASLEAERVYIASFGNLRATSDEISVQFLKKDHGHPVHIVCAGTEGHISLEDSLLAGALASQICRTSRAHARSERRTLFGNDEALMVVSQWLEVERFLEKRPLWSLLSLGRGGQNVLEIGLERRYRCRRPSSTGSIWSPSCDATRCESWPFERDAGMTDGTSGRALPRSCPSGKVTICWTTWTSWSRSASAGGSSSRRARSTAGSTASGTTARWASS